MYRVALATATFETSRIEYVGIRRTLSMSPNRATDLATVTMASSPRSPSSYSRYIGRVGALGIGSAIADLSVGIAGADDGSPRSSASSAHSATGHPGPKAGTGCRRISPSSLAWQGLLTNCSAGSQQRSEIGNNTTRPGPVVAFDFP
jgi:hypothetical protein